MTSVSSGKRQPPSRDHGDDNGGPLRTNSSINGNLILGFDLDVLMGRLAKSLSLMAVVELFVIQLGLSYL